MHMITLIKSGKYCVIETFDHTKMLVLDTLLLNFGLLDEQNKIWS